MAQTETSRRKRFTGNGMIQPGARPESKLPKPGLRMPKLPTKLPFRPKPKAKPKGK